MNVVRRKSGFNRSIGSAGFSSISNTVLPSALSGLTLWVRSDLGVTINPQVITSPNDFSVWTQTNVTVTANATTDPFGGSTADLVTESTAAAAHLVNRGASNSFVVGSSYTVSVYAKPNGRNFIIIEADGKFCYFNIATGAVGTKSASVTGTIVSAGNGWYKCTIAFTGTNTTGSCSVYLAQVDGVSSYTGDGTSGAYLYTMEFTGGSVSAWADQSGNGNHLSQGTSAQQPAFVSSDASFNSHPVVSFSSAGPHRLPSTSTISYGVFTIFYVVGPLTAAGTYYWTRMSGATYREYGYGASPASYVGYRSGPGGASAVNDSSSAVWGAAFSGAATVRNTMDGTHAGHFFHFNGTNRTSSLTANDPGTASVAGTLCLADEPTGVAAGTFKIAEFLIYNRVLTGAECSQVESYLRSRYGHY